MSSVDTEVSGMHNPQHINLCSHEVVYNNVIMKPYMHTFITSSVAVI